MKIKFIISLILSSIWLIVSAFFAVFWAEDISLYLPVVYVWWVIIGIALLPGFLVSTVFFSNIMHRKVERYPDTCEKVTVIICAYNEEKSIARAIRSVCEQDYMGFIRLLVIDNYSNDRTKQIALEVGKKYSCDRVVEYMFCGKPGKSHALNTGLSMVKTKYFVTVDADTVLEKHAVQNIMNHIASKKSDCVAGNLFVLNGKSSIVAKMQIYDYLLSIAAIKRFQGSYRSTLVAQGAFSAYSTMAVRDCGGWKDCQGEDIVLTYQLLEKGLVSTYEPAAVGYTAVPEKLGHLYKQRKRWAIGMLEGFTQVKPWKQGTFYSKFMACINISVIYLDFAYLLGFIPGVILALFGYYYFVGCLTLLAILLSIIWFSSMYVYQKKLKIPFSNSLIGFIFYLLFFQAFQSIASVDGYFTKMFGGKNRWK